MMKRRASGRKDTTQSRATLSCEERKKRVIRMLGAQPGRKYTLKSLAAESGGAGHDGRQTVRQILEELLADGIMECCGRGKYRMSLAHLPSYEGVVEFMPSGVLFVTVEELQRDVFIDSKDGLHALPGDRVRVVVTGKKGRDGKLLGEVVAVEERSGRNYLGTVDVQKNTVFVRTENRRLPDVYIGSRPDKGICSGQKVLFRVTDWPEDTQSPVGQIVDILGMAGENDTEMHAILAEFDLPYRFEAEVEQAARRIDGRITQEEIGRRRDFRQTVTFTIDPEDAKDFDDALSVRRTENGLWEVGVHIADVTHYVAEGSVVDQEAVSRATSVYLVDRTIPMLPERLSNNLCSLRPDEEKLCFSAVFEMDDSAAVRSQWFGRTVIRSDRRFTYAQAQEVIETGRGDYAVELQKLNELAKQMRAERFRAGSINFDREEVKFRLDDKGHPVGVMFKEMKDSNRLIEEFMLLANRKVAEFVGKSASGRKTGRTFVYRVHDKPDEERLSKFSDFVLRFGYYVKTDKPKRLASQLNKLMSEIKGRSEENLISILAIRTMAKAVYTTDNIGHYGLAFPYYTHFTSPIRRYPDMMVHRLLAHYLDGGRSTGREACEALCDHSSKMEVRASEAERASIKYKMVEFMQDKIGKEFDGHISGITDWGIFVELEESHIEGLVAMRDIADDFYRFDEWEYAAIGQRTGRRFTLGDPVRIRIKRADLQHRQLDFDMVASIDFATGTASEVKCRRAESSGRTTRSKKRA